jgi:hypothetical protein
MEQKKDSWSSEHKIKVSSKLPHSPASNYIYLDVKKVAVCIESDEEEFIPKHSLEQAGKAELIANIPEKEVLLSESGSHTFDCGFSLKIPVGYKCCVSSLVPGLFVETLESKRFKLKVFNSGSKIMLRHKQKIAKMWIEPIYFFEWIVKE